MKIHSHIQITIPLNEWQAQYSIMTSFLLHQVSPNKETLEIIPLNINYLFIQKTMQKLNNILKF